MNEPIDRSSKFKLKIVINSFKRCKTDAQVALEHGIQASQIQKWRSQLLEKADEIFVHKNIKNKSDLSIEKFRQGVSTVLRVLF